jgi:hypothetical protein
MKYLETMTAFELLKSFCAEKIDKTISTNDSDRKKNMINHKAGVN